jgi:hypothetical protein
LTGQRTERNQLTVDYLAHPAAKAGGALRVALAAQPNLVASYGDRFLPRPVLLDTTETQTLATDLTGLFRLLVTLPDRVTGGDLRAYGRLLGLSDTYVDLTLRTGTGRPALLGRADLHHDGSGFRVLEFNLSSAVGGLDGAGIAKTMLGVPAISDFATEHHLSYVDSLTSALGLLLDRYGDDTPTIALMDWPSSYARLGVRLSQLATFLSGLGLPTIACHAGEARFAGGRLLVRDQPVDVVYRVFTLEEALAGPEPAELIEPIVLAAESGAVDLFLPFDIELYGNKRGLALLADPRIRTGLSKSDHALVERLLPWTCSLDDLAAERPGLLDECQARQNDLVLKPAMGHGGRGVLPGWTVSPEHWRDALRASVDNAHIVQQRVRSVPESFDENGELVPWLLKWGVFVVEGRYAGALVQGTRELDAGVVNRASAGGMTACLHQPPPNRRGQR